MFYYSTNKQSPKVNFREATIRGQAPDKGLYFPEYIPAIPTAFIRDMEMYSNEEIAYRVIQPYVGNTIPDDGLRTIVTETINFPIPLVQLNEKIFSLELFHGPTLAFKDVGARFMSRCLGYFARNYDKKVNVLVATSGDTGGAVANGFYDIPGVDVIILYPSGKVSLIQEKQLTTLGKNIHALEVKGNFDDCQIMVKQAFADSELNKKLFLTSANSINIARWLPQQLYYFLALKQWKDKEHAPVICVPSGNFGNICAGLVAYFSGLPVDHFIAACNANDVVSQYLSTGNYQPKLAKATLSNAMDVGDPSNFVRVLELFQHKFAELKSMLSSYTISDEETIRTISEVYQTQEYLLDPHGAVGFLSLQRFLENHPGKKGIFLETAHPVKFPETIKKITGQEIPIPEHVKGLIESKKQSATIKPEIGMLTDFLYSIN
jgi:threonine synthase